MATTRKLYEKIINHKHEDAMAKFGAVLGQGIIDAGDFLITIIIAIMIVMIIILLFKVLFFLFFFFIKVVEMLQFHYNQDLDILICQLL